MDEQELIFTEEYARAVDDYFAKLGTDAIPSRILQPPQLAASPSDLHGGSPDAPPLSRGAWRQICFDMQRGARDGLVIPSLETFDESMSSSGDEFPIAILDLRYHAVRLTASAYFFDVIKRRATAAVPEPSRIVEERRVFAAGPLRDVTARGESVTFRIAPSIVSNIDEPLTSMEIDCGDGKGWRPVAAGDAVTASYAEIGQKIIRLRATRSVDLLQTSFLFEVERVSTPIYNDSWTQRSDWPYGGEYGSANVYVWYANGKSAITKPLIISEGFDPTNEMTWDRLYNSLGDLAPKLRAGGYDIVIVDMTKGGDHLQRNGLVFASAIVRTISKRHGKEPATVLGVSMGGLVARYALCALENKGITHEVTRYISFDSPHEGANIPLAIQYFGDYFREKSATAKELVDKVLNCPAARQMLRYHYDWGGDEHVKADPMRATFLADLGAVGSWPKVRRVAISNGRTDGTSQGFADGSDMIRWASGGEVWANLWVLPAFNANAGQLVFQGFYCGSVKWERWVRSARPYDRAPGGWRRTTKEVAEAIKGLGIGTVTYDWWHHCFVPATSALAIDESRLMDKIEATSVTNFDSWTTTQPENTGHIEITTGIITFVMQELGVPIAVEEPRMPVRRSAAHTSQTSADAQ